MKTVYLNGNIEEFVHSIAEETVKGNNVAVKMCGCNTIFEATVYAWSSIAAVRMAIISKLKVIKAYEQNVQLLKHVYPSDILSKYLANATPDEVAELCFESGLVSAPTPETTSKCM